MYNKLPQATYQTTKKIWMDGELIDWDKAFVHVMVHGLHYGSSVFEGVRFYDTAKGPAIFRLEDHTKRLFYSASVIDISIPYSENEINKAQLNLLKQIKVKSGYIRPLAFYGYGKMGLNPVGANVNVIVAAWPWGSYLGGEPIRVKVSKYIRIHPQSLIADAKVSGHYVNSILASLEMQKEGYDEALLLDFEGNVAEGPGENLFIVKDNKVYTPKLGTILPGITRNSIIEILDQEFDTKVIEKKITLEEVMDADEAFYTGTAAEIQPIGSIDEKNIGNGKAGILTTKVRNMFMDIVEGKNAKYEHWLSYVK